MYGVKASEALTPELQLFGYTDLRQIDGKQCGLLGFMFTTGLMVGLDSEGYERRYCYEHQEDALAALAVWDGTGHPSGPWIKLKGMLGGERVDLLNPELNGG